MSYHAIIVGLSGREAFLRIEERAFVEVTDRKKAKPFRSERAAELSAQSYLSSLPNVCGRHMSYRVEPADAKHAEAA